MNKISTFYDHIMDISRQEEMSMVEALQEARNLGVELLEVSQNNLLGREDELGNELAYAGLKISSIPAYFDFGRDTDVDRQSEPTLEAARFLGVKTMLVIPGFFQPEDGPEERDRQIKNMVECINRLAEKAAGYGVSLEMEDYDSDAAHFSTAAGVRDFLDGCPALSCCFDTGNFRFAAGDEIEAFEKLRDRITHVHWKDRAYTPLNGEAGLTAADGQKLYPCPVGSGEMKLEELADRLKKEGYSGICTVELYGANKTADYLKRSVSWLREHL